MKKNLKNEKYWEKLRKIEKKWEKNEENWQLLFFPVNFDFRKRRLLGCMWFWIVCWLKQVYSSILFIFLHLSSFVFAEWERHGKGSVSDRAGRRERLPDGSVGKLQHNVGDDLQGVTPDAPDDPAEDWVGQTHRLQNRQRNRQDRGEIDGFASCVVFQRQLFFIFFFLTICAFISSSLLISLLTKFRTQFYSEKSCPHLYNNSTNQYNTICHWKVFLPINS